MGTELSQQRDSWGMVALLSAAAVIAYMDRLVLSVLFVPLSQDMSLTDTQLGLLQGASFAVIYALAGLPLGMAADRYNRRNLIITGIVVWCGATIACGFAANFTQLAIARVFVGVGEAALVPAATSMIGDGIRLERRGRALSVFIMGQILGGGIAVAAGGVLLDLVEGHTFDPALFSLGIEHAAPWRVVLWLVGILGLPLLIALFCIREPRRREHAARDGLSPSAVAKHFIARRHTLLPLYLMLACAAVSDFSIGAWIPTLLVRQFDWSTTRIGLWFGGCLFASGMIAAAIAGMVSDRATRSGGARNMRFWALGSAILALVMTTFALATDARLLLLMLFVQAVASSICSVICVISIQVSLPNELRGVGSALTSLGNMLFGLGCGPTLVALATDYLYRDPDALGWSMVTVTVPAFALGATLLLLSIYRGARLEHPFGRT